jgi:hypothetical protein
MLGGFHQALVDSSESVNTNIALKQIMAGETAVKIPAMMYQLPSGVMNSAIR